MECTIGSSADRHYINPWKKNKVHENTLKPVIDAQFCMRVLGLSKFQLTHNPGPVSDFCNLASEASYSELISPYSEGGKKSSVTILQKKTSFYNSFRRLFWLMV